LGAVALARLVHFADNTQLAQPKDPADSKGKARGGATQDRNSLNPATKRILGGTVRMPPSCCWGPGIPVFKSQSGELRLQQMPLICVNCAIDAG
jgi:hypothetical protein